MLNCKETAHLLSTAQDRPLAFGERLALEMHLLICKGCANYRKQVAFLRAACQWRTGGNDKEMNVHSPSPPSTSPSPSRTPGG